MAKKSSTSVAIPVRALTGTSSKKTVDAPAFFTASPLALIARAIHTTEKRMRVRRAHTKERAEVAGGGRKPWKQKGTGRSRHGSSRSPLWVGGGITFGPRSRKSRIPKTQLKERRRALAGSFALHVAQGSLSMLEIEKDTPIKTATIAKNFGDATSVLIVLDASHAKLERGIRNIASVRCRPASSVRAKEILEAKEVWIDQAALPVLETRCIF
jgi:large subunit ribosomal protein L4